METKVNIHNTALLFKPYGDPKNNTYDILLFIHFDVKKNINICRETRMIPFESATLIYDIMTNPNIALINNKISDIEIKQFQEVKMAFLIDIIPKNNFNDIKRFQYLKKEFFELQAKMKKDYVTDFR